MRALECSRKKDSRLGFCSSNEGYTSPRLASQSAVDKAGEVLIAAIGQRIVDDLRVHAHSRKFWFPLLHTLTTSIGSISLIRQEQSLHTQGAQATLHEAMQTYPRTENRAGPLSTSDAIRGHAHLALKIVLGL